MNPFLDRLKDSLGSDYDVRHQAGNAYSITRYVDGQALVNQRVYDVAGMPALEGREGPYGPAAIVLGEVRDEGYDKSGQVRSSFVDHWSVLGELMDHMFDFAQDLGREVAHHKVIGGLERRYQKAGLDNPAHFYLNPLRAHDEMSRVQLARLFGAALWTGQRLEAAHMAHVYQEYGFTARDQGNLLFYPQNANVQFSGGASGMWGGVQVGSDASNEQARSKTLPKLAVKRLQDSAVTDRLNEVPLMRTVSTVFGSGGLLSDGEEILADDIRLYKSRQRGLTLPEWVTSADHVELLAPQTVKGREKLPFIRLQRDGEWHTFHLTGSGDISTTYQDLTLRQRKDGRFHISFVTRHEARGKSAGESNKNMTTSRRRRWLEEGLFGGRIGTVDRLTGAPNDTMARARSIFRNSPELLQRHNLTVDDLESEDARTVARVRREYRKALAEGKRAYDRGEMDAPLLMWQQSFDDLPISAEQAELFREERARKAGYQVTERDGQHYLHTPQLWLQAYNDRPEMRGELSWRDPGVNAADMIALSRMAPTMYEQLVRSADNMGHYARALHTANINQGATGLKPVGRTVDLKGVDAAKATQIRQQMQKLAGGTDIADLTDRDYLDLFRRASSWQTQSFSHTRGGKTRYLPSVVDVIALSSRDEFGREKNPLVSSVRQALHESLLRHERGSSVVLDRAVRAASDRLDSWANSPQVHRDLMKASIRRSVGLPISFGHNVPEGYAVLPDADFGRMLPKAMSMKDWLAGARGGDDGNMLGLLHRNPVWDPMAIADLTRFVPESYAKEKGWMPGGRLQTIMASAKAHWRHLMDNDADAGAAMLVAGPDTDPARRDELLRERDAIRRALPALSWSQDDQRQSYLDQVLGKTAPTSLREATRALSRWFFFGHDELQKERQRARQSKLAVGPLYNALRRGEVPLVEEKFGTDAAMRYLRFNVDRAQAGVDMLSASEGLKREVELRRTVLAERKDDGVRWRVPATMHELKPDGTPGWRSHDSTWAGLARGMLDAFFSNEERMPIVDGEYRPEMETRHLALARTQREADVMQRLLALDPSGQSLHQSLIGRLANSQYVEQFFTQTVFGRELGGAIMRRHDQRTEQIGTHGSPKASWRDIGRPAWVDTVLEQRAGLDRFLSLVGGSGKNLLSSFSDAVQSRLGGTYAAEWRAMLGIGANYQPGDDVSTIQGFGRDLANRLMAPLTGLQDFSAEAGARFGEARTLFMSHLSMGGGTLVASVLRDQLFAGGVLHRTEFSERRQAAMERGNRIEALLAKHAETFFPEELGELVMSDRIEDGHSLRGWLRRHHTAAGRQLDIAGISDLAFHKAGDDFASVVEVKASRGAAVRGLLQAVGYATAQGRPRELERAIGPQGDIVPWEARVDTTVLDEYMQKGMSEEEALLRMHQDGEGIHIQKVDTSDKALRQRFSDSIAQLGAITDAARVHLGGSALEEGHMLRALSAGDNPLFAPAMLDHAVRVTASELLKHDDKTLHQLGLTREQATTLAKAGLQAPGGWGETFGHSIFGTMGSEGNAYDAYLAAGGYGGGPPEMGEPPPATPSGGGQGASGGKSRSKSALGANLPVIGFPFGVPGDGGWWSVGDDGEFRYGTSDRRFNMRHTTAEKLLGDLPGMMGEAKERFAAYHGQIKRFSEEIGFNPETNRIENPRITQARELAERQLETLNNPHVSQGRKNQVAEELQETAQALRTMRDEIKDTSSTLRDQRKQLEGQRSELARRLKVAETYERTHSSDKAVAKEVEDLQRLQSKFKPGSERYQEYQREIDTLLDSAPLSKNLEHLRENRLAYRRELGDLDQQVAMLKGHETALQTAERELSRDTTRASRAASQHQEQDGFARQRQMYRLMSLSYMPFQLMMTSQWEFGADLAQSAYEDHLMGMLGGRGSPDERRIRRGRAAGERLTLAMGRGRYESPLVPENWMNEDMAYAWGKWGAPAAHAFGLGLNAVMFDAMVMENAGSRRVRAAGSRVWRGGQRFLREGLLLGSLMTGIAAPTLALSAGAVATGAAILGGTALGVGWAGGQLEEEGVADPSLSQRFSRLDAAVNRVGADIFGALGLEGLSRSHDRAAYRYAQRAGIATPELHGFTRTHRRYNSLGVRSGGSLGGRAVFDENLSQSDHGVYRTIAAQQGAPVLERYANVLADMDYRMGWIEGSGDTAAASGYSGQLALEAATAGGTYRASDPDSQHYLATLLDQARSVGADINGAKLLQEHARARSWAGKAAASLYWGDPGLSQHVDTLTEEHLTDQRRPLTQRVGEQALLERYLDDNPLTSAAQQQINRVARLTGTFAPVQHALSIAEHARSFGLDPRAVAMQVATLGTGGGYLRTSSPHAVPHRKTLLGRMTGALGGVFGPAYQAVMEADAWAGQITSRVAPYLTEDARADLIGDLASMRLAEPELSDAALFRKADIKYGFTPYGHSVGMLDQGRADLAIVDPKSGRPYNQFNAIHVSAARASGLGLDEFGFTGGTIASEWDRQGAQAAASFQQQRAQLALNREFGQRSINLGWAQLGLSRRQFSASVAHGRRSFAFQAQGMEMRHEAAQEDMAFQIESAQRRRAFQVEVARPYQREMFNFSRDTARMQHAFAQQMGAFQAGTMALQNQFWNEERALSGQMRLLRRESGTADRADARNAALLQRQWWFQDWERGQQSAEREFGWKMEDYNEAIRYASGRERRRLVKEKERDVIRHEESRGTSQTAKERQEALAEIEDRRYERSEEATQRLQALEDQLWKMQTDHHNTMAERQQAAHAMRMAHADQMAARREEAWKKQEEYQQDVEQWQDEEWTRQEQRFDTLQTRLDEQQQLEKAIFDANRAHQETLWGLQEEQFGIQAQRLKDQQDQLDAIQKIQQDTIDNAEGFWRDSRAAQRIAIDNADRLYKKLNGQDGALSKAVEVSELWRRKVVDVERLLKNIHVNPPRPTEPDQDVDPNEGDYDPPPEPQPLNPPQDEDEEEEEEQGGFGIQSVGVQSVLPPAAPDNPASQMTQLLLEQNALLLEILQALRDGRMDERQLKYALARSMSDTLTYQARG